MNKTKAPQAPAFLVGQSREDFRMCYECAGDSATIGNMHSLIIPSLCREVDSLKAILPGLSPEDTAEVMAACASIGEAISHFAKREAA